MSGIIGGAGSKSGVIGTTELVYEEYIAPSTACTGGLTNSIAWRAAKVGNMVTIHIPGMYGAASNVRTIVLGHALPVNFRPYGTTDFPVVCAIKGNNRYSATVFRAYTNGTMEFHAGRGAPDDLWGTGNPTGLEYNTCYSWPHTNLT